jgi:hypothetical protein
MIEASGSYDLKMIPIFIGLEINKCFSMDEKALPFMPMLGSLTRFILNV